MYLNVRCCNITKSTGIIGIINKTAYKKERDIQTLILYDKFEILIKCKNGEKYSFKVTKTMTIGELKDKLKKEIGINKDNYELTYKRPLHDLSKTLDYYGINKTLTLIMISNLIGGCSGILKEINIKLQKKLIIHLNLCSKKKKIYMVY